LRHLHSIIIVCLQQTTKESRKKKDTLFLSAENLFTSSRPAFAAASRTNTGTQRLLKLKSFSSVPKKFFLHEITFNKIVYLFSSPTPKETTVKFFKRFLRG
jgi:hypothetical protein